MSQPTVHVTNKKVTINSFSTMDPNVVSYFASIAELDRHTKLEEVLKIGIISMRSVADTGAANYVDKAFENLENKFTNILDLEFSDAGKFNNLLRSHFGEDGLVVKEIFDPNREGSPLHQIKADILREISAMRDMVVAANAAEDARKAEHQRGTQKGREFEGQCAEILAPMADLFGDILEETGAGSERGTSKKGDIVVTLPNQKKIVFEMKNQASPLPSRRIQSELKEGMYNRDAVYGVLISRNRSALHDSVGWFNEYNGNQLVCAVSDNPSDDSVDYRIIQIAYKWARLKAYMNSVGGREFDPSVIYAKTEQIENRIKDLSKIKKRCTVIEDSTYSIREMVDDIGAEILDSLDDIVESVNTGTQDD